MTIEELIKHNKKLSPTQTLQSLLPTLRDITALHGFNVTPSIGKQSTVAKSVNFVLKFNDDAPYLYAEHEDNKAWGQYVKEIDAILNTKFIVSFKNVGGIFRALTLID